jgi:SulP family sulfate permease
VSDRTIRKPGFADLYTPKLVTLLREGYRLRDLQADAIAGLTVAVVALPLSMAIAIACGLSPDRGLYTAIVGGFFVSALGGSRFQIGGPAGAFIVLIFSIVERQGYDGLVIATMMAGAIMLVVGFMRWGTYIKYIPYPVTVGFTTGIAVIIFASQIKELVGLDLDREPAALVPKLTALAGAIGTMRPMTLAISILAAAIILILRRLRPNWPGILIAVALCAALTGLLHLDVATIGSRFGGVPRTLPSPALPAFDLARMWTLLPDAFAIALLGAIESLLSAVVADGMTGRRHRSNCELVAQGVANILAPIFGGMPVTGTVARTATNVRSGAKGPIAGMLHALYVLLFMLIAAPLAAYIPLASLGAVLAVVAWSMAEREEFVALVRAFGGDALVLLATFLLTIFESLTLGIGVGVTLAAFLFLHRMAETIEVREGRTSVDEDEADSSEAAAFATEAPPNPDLIVYKISGAFFFGAAAAVSAALDRVGRYPSTFVFDFADVSLIDTTAAKALAVFVRKLRRANTHVSIAKARPGVRRALLTAGLREPEVSYVGTISEARERAAADPVATELSLSAAR